MAKTMTDDEILAASIEIAERRLRAAAAAKRLADADAAVPPRRLSIRAWRAGALRQAGHDAAPIGVLKHALTTRAGQFPAVVAYAHGIAMAIRENEWRGISPELTAAPATWRASREDAEREIALVGGGVNLWTAISVSLDDVYAAYPEAFGPVDDVAEEERRRLAPHVRADAALRDLDAVPTEILLGMALARGIDPHPQMNLGDRLRAHEMAGSPRRASARADIPADGVTFLTGRATP